MTTEAIKTKLANPQEARSLAREMHDDFRSAVETFKRYENLSEEDARKKVNAMPETQKERALNGPAEQVRWWDLNTIAETDPDRALERWEEIKEIALAELQSGHRAARSLEFGFSSPLERARFFAICTELSADLQPRDGIERQLIDQMALAQSAMFFWLDNLMTRSGLPAKDEKDDVRNEGKWKPMRVSDHQAIEQSGQMYDRFHKIFLRTLRALRELRRHPPSIHVQNAGQVNVGANQINVANA